MRTLYATHASQSAHRQPSFLSLQHRRRGAFVDEPVPRLVIGGIGSEEAPGHLRQLLDPVGSQRLSALVGDPPLALGLELLLEVRVPGELLGSPYGLRFELVNVVTETVVQKPKVPGLTRAG